MAKATERLPLNVYGDTRKDPAKKVGHFFRGVGQFLWNFVRMCLTMCLIAVILSVAFFGGAALISHPDLISEAPYFSTVVLAINFTLPMVGWMRYRHHEWRPTLEMSGASMGLVIVLIALGWLGIIPMSDVFGWEASLCCPSMLVPMLFRHNLYTESTGQHAHST